MSVKYFGSDALNKLIDLIKTALGLKADDSNVVHKTGDETVGGTKTFSDLTYHSRPNSDSPLYIKGSSDQSWIGFTSATGDTFGPFGYLGVKNDNKPYFYKQGAKRLALLDETFPVFGSNDVSSNDCNTWTAKGVYQGLDVTNSPVTGWITVITIPAGNENANYCEQRLFVTASNDVYSRYRVNGTWNSWVNNSTANCVQKTGDTMTGALIFSGSGGRIQYAGPGNTYNMIRFTDGDQWGHGIIIGGGGLSVLGGGEAANVIADQYGGSDERAIIANDSSVQIFTNLQSGWANRKEYIFDNTYNEILLPSSGSIRCGSAIPRYQSSGGTDGQGGLSISQGNNETSGIHFGGNYITMWSPCDSSIALKYFDTDDGSLVYKMDSYGCLVGGMANPSSESQRIWFGQDGNGKWGYKTTKTGTITPFRNPTGNAAAGDVRSGKTFSNASADGLTGSWIPTLRKVSPSGTGTTRTSVSSSTDITVSAGRFLVASMDNSSTSASIVSGTGTLLAEGTSTSPRLWVFKATTTCSIRFTNSYSYTVGLRYAQFDIA